VAEYAITIQMELNLNAHTLAVTVEQEGYKEDIIVLLLVKMSKRNIAKYRNTYILTPQWPPSPSHWQ
jgi:hypothetical protein